MYELPKELISLASEVQEAQRAMHYWTSYHLRIQRTFWERVTKKLGLDPKKEWVLVNSNDTIMTKEEFDSLSEKGIGEKVAG